MTRIAPLPFRLMIAGQDTINFGGARSVSYRLEGLLHLRGDALLFEWGATRQTQHVSFSGVQDVVDESPIGTARVALQVITRASVRGGWWVPRVQFWGRTIDAFDAIPGSRPEGGPP